MTRSANRPEEGSILKRTRSIVRGVGSYLPRRVMTNQDLAKFVETSHEWIVQRTGIEERHIAEDDETTSMLGIRAAQAALADAGPRADDIDLIICATSTPDYTFPSTATHDPDGPRHHSRRRLRPAGRLHRLRLCGVGGGQVPRLGLAQARAGDRRRNLLAHARLERPHHLRALRRRRGRHRAGSRGGRGHQCATAAC